MALDPNQQPSVALLDRPWVRTLILSAVSGAVSLAVTSATLTWQGRDYLDTREEKLLTRIRTETQATYLSEVEYYRLEVERAREINTRLQRILDKLD